MPAVEPGEHAAHCRERREHGSGQKPGEGGGKSALGQKRKCSPHACRQKQKEDRQFPDSHAARDLAALSGLLDLLPGALRALPGEGALADGGLRPQQGLHGFVPLRPGPVHGSPGGLQIDDGPPEPGNGVVLRDPVRPDLSAEILGPLFRGGGLGLGRGQSAPAAEGLPAVTVVQLLQEGGLPRCQNLRVPAGLSQLAGQLRALRPAALQVGPLRLQRRQLAGLVVAAAVQLPLQGVPGLREGGVLLAGGDQGGDAPLQLGIL